LRAEGLRFRVSGFDVSGFGLRAPGFGLRASGFGFRVSGFRIFGFSDFRFRISSVERPLTERAYYNFQPWALNPEPYISPTP